MTRVAVGTDEAELAQESARLFDDLDEGARVETRASDERAIDVRLLHQVRRVRGFHAASVLDAHFFGGGRIGYLCEHLADESMRFLCLFRCRRAAGTDGPDGFV